MTGRSRPWILPAILLLGLLLRLWVAAHVAVIAGDGIRRIGIAGTFAREGWSAGLQAALQAGYHPFNPVLIWLLGAPSGSFEGSGFAVSILFGLIGIGGIFLLAREVWGEREGLLAALLWALLPNAVHFSADILTEGQFLAFWILSAWSGLVALKRRSSGWAFAAGALAGLAYETRPEGFGIPIFLGAALALLAWRKGKSAVRERAWQAAALAAGFLLLAFPYLLHLRVAKGAWMVTPHKSFMNLMTRQSTVWRDSSSDPGGGGTAPPMAEYWKLAEKGMDDATPWGLALAALGLCVRRPWASGGIYLLGLGALQGGAVLRLLQTAGYGSHRHLMPLAVISTAWGASGLAWGLEGLARRRSLIPGILLGGVLCGASLAQACQRLRADKAYRREFAVWLGAHTEPDAQIATRDKPEIAYYARRKELNFSDAFPSHAPHWLVLERDPESDGSWLPRASLRPQYVPVPLPAHFEARFALFRRESR